MPLIRYNINITYKAISCIFINMREIVANTGIIQYK